MIFKHNIVITLSNNRLCVSEIVYKKYRRDIIDLTSIIIFTPFKRDAPTPSTRIPCRRTSESTGERNTKNAQYHVSLLYCTNYTSANES